jgi:hypothetical protein
MWMRQLSVLSFSAVVTAVADVIEWKFLSATVADSENNNNENTAIKQHTHIRKRALGFAARCILRDRFRLAREMQRKKKKKKNGTEKYFHTNASCSSLVANPQRTSNSSNRSVLN